MITQDWEMKNSVKFSKYGSLVDSLNLDQKTAFACSAHENENRRNAWVCPQTEPLPSLWKYRSLNCRASSWRGKINS